MGGEREYKYARVARALREGIENGTYPPGSALPSEHELVRTFDVSRRTAIAALDVLRSEGWIYTQTGSGSYVSGMRPKEELSRRGLDLLEDSEVARAGELLQAGIVVAPPRVASLLQLGRGAKAFVRRCLLRDEEGPTELVSAWFPLEVAANTALGSPEPLSAGIRRHLWERKKIRLDHAVERVLARSATSEEASQLGIPEGSAVLNLAVTGHDAQGAAQQLIDAVLPGNRHELRDVYPLH